LHNSSLLHVLTGVVWKVLLVIKQFKLDKVNFLCALLEYLAIKPYLVLHWAPFHEGILKSGGMAACILNLGTRRSGHSLAPAALILGKVPLPIG